MIKTKIILLLLTALTSNHVFSWGKVGHMAVGDIAEKFLTLEAGGKVRDILKDVSLGEATVWADEIRNDPKTRARIARKFYKWNGQDPEKIVNQWHYLTAADHTKYNPSNAPKEGDSYKAIVLFYKVLKSNRWSKQDKKEALMLLTHFLGDLHQPLHNGNGTDLGGNRCVVNWFPDKSRRYFTYGKIRQGENYQNLHKIWDSLIFEQLGYSRVNLADFLMRPNPILLGYPSAQKIREYQGYSQSRLRKVFKDQIRYWQSTNIEKWIQESLKWRFLTYPDRNTSSSTNKKYCRYSQRSTQIDPKDIPVVRSQNSQAFKHMRYLAELRILQAGVRLANVINYAFKSN